MARKKQQSIDRHLKSGGGGGGTVSKNDVIELSGTEDDAAMEVSDTSAAQPRAKTPATRRAGARKTTKEETTKHERSRQEEVDLERALEESRREKEREDRRNRRQWEDEEEEEEEGVDMKGGGNGSKGSGTPASPVTLLGEVPNRSKPQATGTVSRPELAVPRPPLLEQPGVVPRPPLLHQPGVVPRPTLFHQPGVVPRSPLLHQPIVTLERITVPSNCSPVRPHPSHTVLGCGQSDARKGAVPSCDQSSPVSEGWKEGVISREGGVFREERTREQGTGSSSKSRVPKVLSLSRRQDRGKREGGGGGGMLEISESDRGVGGSQASPSKRDVKIEKVEEEEGTGVEEEEEEDGGTGGVTSRGGKPRARSSVPGTNCGLSSANVSKPGGGSPVQTKIDTATPTVATHPVQAMDPMPPPPQLWAPPGTSTSQYTSVILRVFDDYIKQLEVAQSRQLVRIPWGPPVTPKSGTICHDTSRYRVNKKEVWSLPYREESNLSDTSDESEPPQPAKPPAKNPAKPPAKILAKPPAKAPTTQPTKRFTGVKVTYDDESDVFNFSDSSDGELNIETPPSSCSKPNYTITPTKGSTTAAAKSPTASHPIADTEQCSSPADKDTTPPLSGGGPFESKGKVSPRGVAKVSPMRTGGVGATPSNRGVAATPSNSAWLSKRDVATPSSRVASGSKENRSRLGRKRKPGHLSSSFDELVDDMAKKHKSSSLLPAKPPHKALWASREREVKEEEEGEEGGSLESESSEEVVSARSGRGVIDLTEDSQAPGDPSKAMSVCPLCMKRFAQAEIEDHAATCQADDIEDGVPPPSPKVSRLGPPNETRNVLESGECSGRQLEVLLGSPNEEDETTPSPKMATSPQLYPSSEGGYVVDMNTVSDSPVKTYRPIPEQADSELYYKSFVSSEAGESTHDTGQKSQSKRGVGWNGKYQGSRKRLSRSRGRRGKKGTNLYLK